MKNMINNTILNISHGVPVQIPISIIEYCSTVFTMLYPILHRNNRNVQPFGYNHRSYQHGVCTAGKRIICSICVSLQILFNLILKYVFVLYYMIIIYALMVLLIAMLVTRIAILYDLIQAQLLLYMEKNISCNKMSHKVQHLRQPGHDRYCTIHLRPDRLVMTDTVPYI